jgi:hypothetical protein
MNGLRDTRYLFGSISRWGACHEQLSVDIANETLGCSELLRQPEAIAEKCALSLSRPICISNHSFRNVISCPGRPSLGQCENRARVANHERLDFLRRNSGPTEQGKKLDKKKVVRAKVSSTRFTDVVPPRVL